MQQVIIHEVGPRDGLQNERTFVPVDVRSRWIEGILESGIDAVQLGSFVNPKRVPQMADTEALFERFLAAKPKRGQVLLSALVLNEKGLARGLDCGVEQFCMGVSASRTP